MATWSVTSGDEVPIPILLNDESKVTSVTLEEAVASSRLACNVNLVSETLLTKYVVPNDIPVEPTSPKKWALSPDE